MNKRTVLFGSLLLAFACFGQESESVAGILQELSGVNAAKATPPEAQPVSIAGSDADAAATLPEAQPAWTAGFDTDAAAATLPETQPASIAGSDVPMMTLNISSQEVASAQSAGTIVDGNMVLKTEEDISHAEASIDRVIAPEKGPIKKYLDSRSARTMHRKAEEAAIDTVTASWNGMILRDYQLSASALKDMRMDTLESSTDVRDRFPDVDFPKGAQAVYRPALDRLCVLNTPENIRRMETLLALLEVPAEAREGQIEIETRFIEFAEGALDELGFKWSDVLDGQARSLGGEVKIKDGENLFSDALRTGSDVFDRPSALGAGTAAATGNWTARPLIDGFSDAAGTLTVSGQIDNKNVDMLIRALEQTAGTDVLSAPRVVTRAGEKAVIQVGERHFFPEVFEVDGSEGTIVHPSYQDFSEQLMGVELTVTPNLVEDNLIQMELNPVVRELAGWRKYQIAPANSAYTTYQSRLGFTFQHDAITGQLPIYRTREATTAVTIKDGTTIGMGGLISERTEDFSDRVPVLGSIPLIGRLFRSEGERTVKRDLTIFVTARLIAPDGRYRTGQVVEK